MVRHHGSAWTLLSVLPPPLHRCHRSQPRYPHSLLRVRPLLRHLAVAPVLSLPHHLGSSCGLLLLAYSSPSACPEPHLQPIGGRDELLPEVQPAQAAQPLPEGPRGGKPGRAQ